MSRYFDACERARTIKRLDQLKRLAEDMHDIVHGTLSVPDTIGKAPRLQTYRFVCRPALCLGDVGDAASSQIFLLDPDRRWVRTLSQFYRLGTPTSQNWQRPGA